MNVQERVAKYIQEHGIMQRFIVEKTGMTSVKVSNILNLKQKMTADELKAREDAEKQEKLQNDYDELLKKVTIAENKSQLLAIGYDDALADETAEAMVNGDIAKVFANQKKHIESVEKKVRSELTKKTPKADGGSSDIGITKEALLKMSSGERLKFSQEHPEEYKQLYGGNG